MSDSTGRAARGAGPARSPLQAWAGPGRTDDVTHEELTAWLVAHPRRAEQDRATDLLAAFTIVRRG